MKQLFLYVSFLLLSFLFVASVPAQSVHKSPKWMSNKGYWVVESNIQTPRSSIVYFYNNSNELIHKETVEGKRLNLNRKAVCKRLELVLVQSVSKWEKEQILVKKN
ncbi:MAG: hypothetical protein M3342_02505 [Bacteroidota bacterium]|nr:hypothetical protein [Flavisolibacter sp.]MDQ3842875.1 hypothetical protein [Bacteroidota bacterium]